jgi:hypothetical protein
MFRAFPNPAIRPFFHILVRNELRAVTVHYEQASQETGRAAIWKRFAGFCRNARAKGKRLGRPRVIVDAARIAVLRAHGRSWRETTAEMAISKGSAQRAFCRLPKNA